MLFHVEFIPRENWGPTDSQMVFPMALATLNTIINSGIVKTSGAYADERGGFFVLDIDSPEKLLRLLAPVLDSISINSHPIVSIETLLKLGQEMTK